MCRNHVILCTIVVCYNVYSEIMNIQCPFDALLIWEKICYNLYSEIYKKKRLVCARCFFLYSKKMDSLGLPPT